MHVNDRYAVVGHSIGADIALIHASHSDRCGGIVLVDGAFNVAPPETDWERFSILEDRFFFKTLRWVGRRMGVAPSMSLQEIRSLTEDVERQRPKFGELLASLRVPALYVIGDQADKVPDGKLILERKMRAAAEMTSRYDVTVEYVPCGHFVPLHQANRLGVLIRDFCRSAQGEDRQL